MTPSWPDLIATHLFYGRDKAVTISQIAEDIGCSRRIVEQAVEHLRRDGAPICSGSEGVWLTTSSEELRAQYRRLRARYIHQAQGARELLRTARRFEKFTQETLW
jgi:biotin operon repressor